MTLLVAEHKPDYVRVKKAVRDLLSKNGISEPPVDPVKLARRLGVDVFFVEFDKEDKNISGFYDAEDDAIFVNSEEWPLRQTFTVAHELGHKILHEDWAKSSEYRVLLRDQDASSSDPIEKEANAFAAHLLVPRFMLNRYWQTMSVEQMSELFAVSVPVIKNRLSIEYGISA